MPYSTKTIILTLIFYFLTLNSKNHILKTLTLELNPKP